MTNDMRYSPLTIEILLSHALRGKYIVRDAAPEAVVASYGDLFKSGAIQNGQNGRYEITPLGTSWVTSLCNVHP